MRRLGAIPSTAPFTTTKVVPQMRVRRFRARRPRT